MNTDTEAIRNATEKLTEVSYDVFGKIYQQAAQAEQAAGNPGAEPQNDDGVVDADFEVVDDDNKN